MVLANSTGRAFACNAYTIQKTRPAMKVINIAIDTSSADFVL